MSHEEQLNDNLIKLRNAYRNLEKDKGRVCDNVQKLIREINEGCGALLVALRPYEREGLIISFKKRKELPDSVAKGIIELCNNALKRVKVYNRYLRFVSTKVHNLIQIISAARHDLNGIGNKGFGIDFERAYGMSTTAVRQVERAFDSIEDMLRKAMDDAGFLESTLSSIIANAEGHRVEEWLITNMLSAVKGTERLKDSISRSDDLVKSTKEIEQYEKFMKESFHQNNMDAYASTKDAKMLLGIVAWTGCLMLAIFTEQIGFFLGFFLAKHVYDDKHGRRIEELKAVSQAAIAQFDQWENSF